MDTIVIKFGGSSVADNSCLKIVSNKILELYKTYNNIIVVVSAQGKTTDKLIKEAKELSKSPKERELDMLLSVGEQITSAKLSILLNELGYNAISLTGWQAGIYTNNINQNAIIENINPERIKKELSEGKIVIVSGFQGINQNLDITTLGRGGSDTTAVALAATFNAKMCYICSDVDGIYSADPNKIDSSKKLQSISYSEMLNMSSEGAKVLHNRCVEIAENFKVPIIAQSTFNNNKGTIIKENIEESSIKGIVKSDDIILVNAKIKPNIDVTFNYVYKVLIENNIIIKKLTNIKSLSMFFYILNNDLSKFKDLLNKELNILDCAYYNVSKISIIGHGIMNKKETLNKIINIIDKNKLNILIMDINESKVTLVFDNVISDEILEQLHNKLIA